MINKVKWGVISSGGIARRRTIPEGIAIKTAGLLRGTYHLTVQHLLIYN